MKSLEPYAYVLLRVLGGLLILCHGADRLFEWPEGYSYNVYDRYICGPILLIGGALLTIGLFTRLAAWLCAGMVLAQYLIHHDSGLPFSNGGERWILFLAAFALIACKGGGRLSLDREREDRKKG